MKIGDDDLIPDYGDGFDQDGFSAASQGAQGALIAGSLKEAARVMGQLHIQTRFTHNILENEYKRRLRTYDVTSGSTLDHIASLEYAIENELLAPPALLVFTGGNGGANTPQDEGGAVINTNNIPGGSAAHYGREIAHEFITHYWLSYSHTDNLPEWERGLTKQYLSGVERGTLAEKVSPTVKDSLEQALGITVANIFVLSPDEDP
jgi:hypothetical protein